MSTSKNIDKICVFIFLFTLLITVLFMNGSRFGIEAVADEDAEYYTGSEEFTENDLDGNWDTTGASYIVLNGNSADISGNGAYFNDGSVYIRNGGKYVITGKLSNGSIVVDAYASSKPFLLFDGVNISCNDDAAVRVNQADKVFITLKEGTENTLWSGSEYSDEALEDGTGGTIFSRDDLTINGNGALVIKAEYKHGIDANDDLRITGGRISITAPEDGLHVNDAFRFKDANLEISVEDDAIHADEEILIDSGSILINSCYEGMEARTIEMRGGDVVIYCSDDGINANGNSNLVFGGGFGGGNFEGRMGQGHNMDIASGSAASGMGNFENQRPENANTNAVMEDTEETWIHISGGNVTIINTDGRDADGLDSNGDIEISGGNICVSLVGNGTNNAIDYGSESGGKCVINGGRVVALGGSSMVEGFSDESLQCSILYISSDEIPAGTLLQLLDSEDKVLLEWEVPCSFSAANLSCPELSIGGSYKIVAGDIVEDVNIEGISQSVGETRSGGMGFGGRPGGGRGGETGGMGPGQGQAGGMGFDMSGSGAVKTARQRPGPEPGGGFPGGDPGGGGFRGEQEHDKEESEETLNSGSRGRISIFEMDREGVIYLILSFLVLSAGIVFAIRFRKR